MTDNLPASVREWFGYKNRHWLPADALIELGDAAIRDLIAELEKKEWMLNELLRGGINAVASTREKEEEMRQEIADERRAVLEARYEQEAVQ